MSIRGALQVHLTMESSKISETSSNIHELIPHTYCRHTATHPLPHSQVAHYRPYHREIEKYQKPTVEFSIPLRQCTGISLQRFGFKFRMFSLSSRLKRGLIVNRLHCRTQSTLYAKIDEEVNMFFRVSSLDLRARVTFCASVLLSLGPRLRRNPQTQRLGAALYTPEPRSLWFMSCDAILRNSGVC